MSDAVEVAPVSGADFLARARARLTLDPPVDILGGRVLPGAGDHVLDRLPPAAKTARAAAVLIPVVAHAEEATILLTRRVETLRAHAGQIAFPGGRIDPGDVSPAAAALREAWEEVGLDQNTVTPIGYLDTYLTGTGFLVVPVVASVKPPLALTLNPAEVSAAFEVPLSFLMRPENHLRHAKAFNGIRRHFYAMPFGDHYIWGATAGMLRSLYEKLYLP